MSSSIGSSGAAGARASAEAAAPGPDFPIADRLTKSTSHFPKRPFINILVKGLMHLIKALFRRRHNEERDDMAEGNFDITRKFVRVMRTLSHRFNEF